MRPRLLLVAVAFACGTRVVGVEPARASTGAVRFFKVANSAFDRYTASPSPDEQEWMRSHYWRMLAYSPYFDSRLAWFSDAWVYKDLYAIYVGSPLAAEHPEWVLRDGSGNPLYIPYGCRNGRCPQYAADVGNSVFRARWISDAAALLHTGYRGLFIDDVNLSLSRVTAVSGDPVVPIDPRTGQPMTESDWRRYVAELSEQIRGAFPQAEVVHNALWFVGHDDPFVQRELLSADTINIENGLADLQGGSGPKGFESLLSHIDWLHGQGRGVVLDGGAGNRRGREYGLAFCFLVDTGADALGNTHHSAPGRWWRGYDVSLGFAAGARYAWNGLLRRDFAYGLVLVNPPDAPLQRIALDGVYSDASGARRTMIVLRPATGAVLWTAPPAAATKGVHDDA